MNKLLLSGLMCASVLSSSAAFAAMTTQARTAFVARCETSMYMPHAQCVCMAGIADTKLDDLAVAYLSLDPLDVTNSAAMSKRMTPKELASVDNFMKTAPHKCEAVH